MTFGKSDCRFALDARKTYLVYATLQNCALGAVCLLVQAKKCSDVQKSEACLYTPVNTGATYKQGDGTS